MLKLKSSTACDLLNILSNHVYITMNINLSYLYNIPLGYAQSNEFEGNTYVGIEMPQ